MTQPRELDDVVKEFSRETVGGGHCGAAVYAEIQLQQVDKVSVPAPSPSSFLASRRTTRRLPLPRVSRQVGHSPESMRSV